MVVCKNGVAKNGSGIEEGSVSRDCRDGFVNKYGRKNWLK